MPNSTQNLTLTNEQPFRLMLDGDGIHRFGGTSDVRGAIPHGSTVPLQLVLELDLTDERLPIAADRPLRKLPLLYPFKYGCGGPEVQYSVIADDEIQILHMSDLEPDDPDEQYLQVDELPQVTLKCEPLAYEQARIVYFMDYDGHFQPNDSDRQILSELNDPFYIPLGGRRQYIANAGDIICRNPECEFHDRGVYFKYLAMVPAIPVNGDTSFWCEFEGDVHFCFVLCYYCGTVIAFNVCS